MVDSEKNIILIGMAGSGKSSIGHRLAEELSRSFIDTDDLIADEAGYSLQDIIEQDGLSGFRQLEEKVLLGLNLTGYVIATGGSSVYSSKGMEHLKKKGVVIYLEVELPLLLQRITNFADRGLVKPPEQSFAELYRERIPLYNKYADMIYHCGDKDEREVCVNLLHLLQNEL